MTENQQTSNIDRLLDVEMEVTVRFGSTELPLSEVVHFGSGSMIELNKTVDEPVELLVNNFPFARGEVVVVDGYYGVKITDIDMLVDSSGSPILASPKSASETTQPSYQKAPDGTDKSPDTPPVGKLDAEPTAQPPKPANQTPAPENQTPTDPKTDPKDNSEV